MLLLVKKNITKYFINKEIRREAKLKKTNVFGMISSNFGLLQKVERWDTVLRDWDWDVRVLLGD